MEYPQGLKRGQPDCGIVAIAAVTGQPYQTVKNWFQNKNNHPKQWRGSTFVEDYDEALKALGKVNSYKLHVLKNPLPLHTWSRIYCRRYPGKKFIVTSSGHTMAIQDGIVLDNNDIREVNKHPVKGSRIKEAWVVE